jgi:hypothetical protein
LNILILQESRYKINTAEDNYYEKAL